MGEKTKVALKALDTICLTTACAFVVGVFASDFYRGGICNEKSAGLFNL
jgi:hypothetical protein